MAVKAGAFFGAIGVGVGAIFGLGVGAAVGGVVGIAAGSTVGKKIENKAIGNVKQIKF